MSTQSAYTDSVDRYLGKNEKGPTRCSVYVDPF